MKKLTLILLSFFPFYVMGQNDFFTPETLNDFNLKGSVKTAKEITYKAIKTENGLVKKKIDNIYKWEKHVILLFNDKGKLEKKTHLNNNQKVKQQDEFKYENGLLIYRKTKYTSDSIFYDKKNRIVRIKQIDRTPPVITSGKERPKKRIIRVYEFSYDKPNSMSIFEYENEELKCKEVRKFQQGKIIHQEYDYDSYREWSSFEYDAYGLLFRKNWSDSDEGLIERTTYKYNDQKQIIHEKWELFIEGEYDGVVNYKYSQGNEISVIEKNADGDIDLSETYSYKFDINENWIRRELVIDDEEFYITEREIEYY